MISEDSPDPTIFFSNFYPDRIRWDGDYYPTVEHAFQASKTASPVERDLIARADNPGKAKQLGRSVSLIPGWEEVRFDVMRALLARKFDPYGPLSIQLYETRGKRLIEGNYWHDNTWGDCHCGRSGCSKPGANQLGLMLEDIRQDQVACMNSERPTWDAYFIGIARAVAGRADCVRRRVGAVVVKDRRVRSTGYNGAPAGAEGCISCPRRTSDVVPGSSYDTGAGTCVAVHAEANALLYADREDLIGATLYLTTDPCDGCLKLIRASGIIKIIWPEGELNYV